MKYKITERYGHLDTSHVHELLLAGQEIVKEIDAEYRAEVMAGTDDMSNNEGEN